MESAARGPSAACIIVITNFRRVAAGSAYICTTLEILEATTERASQMFSAEQYRMKAAEYTALLSNIPRSPHETSELRNLEQTYTTLAENEEWMAINIDKTIQRRKYRDDRIGLDDGEEQILRCAGEGPDNAAEYCRHEAPTGAHW
jgi:hypothetical protein